MEKMDGPFFVKMLSQALNDESIRNVNIRDREDLGARGANFSSEILRFSLRFSKNGENERESPITEDISLIIKIEPILVSLSADMIKKQKVFMTELKMFKSVLPEIEKLVKARLSPKFFYGSTSPGMIVLEDLKPLGFKTKDRQSGLSMEHVMMVLERIAQFHAASVYQCERNAALVKSFTKGIFTETTPRNLLRVIEQTLLMVAEKVTQWQDNKFSSIAEKLTVMKEKFAEEIVDVTKYDQEEFCVLNHGDCWINNIMFRENEQGKPVDVVLVDYQMCVYTSPAIDLIYFLSVCPEAKLHTTKNEFFIKEYLRFLSALMERYNCKTRPPTYEAIERAMLKRRMWTILSAIAFHPRMLADSAEIETFDEILSTGITNMNVFKNPTATIILKKVLPMMNDKGYFD